MVEPLGDFTSLELADQTERCTGQAVPQVGHIRCNAGRACRQDDSLIASGRLQPAFFEQEEVGVHSGAISSRL
jgi:hypothetical protein